MRMAQRILVLPDDVVNRIAAGEVVERPASVVKELLENAIDAGATEISILVRKGGMDEIQVLDNGTGMSREDALTAFQRYATSKIRASDDLETMRTLGFRGEALPSIASVSKVRMVTREKTTLGGTEICLQGGEVREVRETGCPKGTDVIIRDLFYNTPARRKFLRSVTTEFSHIVDTVVRIGLAYHHIHLKLFHQERNTIDVPSTEDRMVRIGTLLGNELYRALRRCRVHMDFLSIDGYLGDPGFTYPNAKGIYVYVNGRFIRDRIIHHALMEGYRNLIPKQRYPVAVLFLELPPWGVDVNVHPTKREVRFSAGDLVHRGIVALCSDLREGSGGSVREGSTSDESEALALGVRESPPSYGALWPSADQESRMPPQGSEKAGFTDVVSSLRPVGQIGQTYVVCESPTGLMLIDQHAAHERIVFERLKRAVDEGNPTFQTLLFPETIELSPLEWETAERYLSDLKRVGFDLEPFGRRTLVIKSIPSVLAGKGCDQLVHDLIRDLVAEETRSEIGEHVETMLKVTACHGAIRAGKSLSMEEMVSLLAQMESEGFIRTCPHGRPAWVEISRRDLEKMFMRSS